MSGNRRRVRTAATRQKANWENRTLFHGDNLDFLRAMNTASVDLIATDPPFNKGRDFHATPDSLADGAKFQDRWKWAEIHQEWVDQLQDDHPAAWAVIDWSRLAYGDDMGAFLCFMAVRLLEMHRVLKPTGSIYLHCDPTASHYLKALMDAIFGRRNFRNEIVWRIGWVSGFKTQKRGWIRNHDILLYYVMSEAAAKRFNKEYLPYPPGYVRRDGKPPKGKGIPIEDTWNCQDGDRLDSLMIKSFAKKTGYPTEKPLELYERIIRASSKRGEVVLDPFAGCATTCVAAERQGRQWVGIDIWDKARKVVRDRMKGDLETYQFTFTKKLPKRTDAGETAARYLPTIETRILPLEPWQRLSRAQIVHELAEAQSRIEGLVLCAGCGRELEAPFMELDHIQPRADGGENDISNRILLCRPCNGRKGAKLTMRGLHDENRKARWMQDAALARHARALAKERYEDVRYRRRWPAADTTGNLF